IVKLSQRAGRSLARGRRGTIGGVFRKSGASPRQVAEKQRTFTRGGLEGGKTQALHGGEQNESPRLPVGSGQLLSIANGTVVADEFGMGLGELHKTTGVRFIRRIRFSHYPDRCL